MRAITSKDIEGYLAALMLSSMSIGGLSGLISKKKSMKKSQIKVKEYETELPILKEKEQEAARKCRIFLRIPNKYQGEFILNKMLEFMSSGQAETWKEVTARYEEYMHRMKMENYAQISTELARETRNARRWTATAATLLLLRR